MTDENLRQLLTEHLPASPPSMAEPPLAAIRRRAHRRTSTQMALAGVVVAVIAGGTAVWANTADTAGTGAPAGPGLTDTPTSTPEMLYPTYLPPGYRDDPSGSGTELTYLNPTADPPIPLVIRRLPAEAEVPAEGPPLQSVTVRGHPAEALPIGNGGIALTWLEDGSRFSVSFEVPDNMQIDFVIDETVGRLAVVADGLRARR